MSDEPDEALIWAREYWANRSERQGFSDIADAYRSGKSDKSLRQEVRAYRAGQAASAERIKALEEDVRWVPELIAALEAALGIGPKYQPWVQSARALLAKIRSQHAARNPLKEADQ